MAVREIRVYPDPILREPTRWVDPNDPRVQSVIDDLFDTMRAAEGLGLAAPQIGESMRVFVVDLSSVNLLEEPRAYVNPVVEVEDVEDEAEEGCLSLPGLFLPTVRAEHIVIRALDRSGEPFTWEAQGIAARALSHENDHLHGRLFIDRQAPLSLDMLKKHLVFEPYVPPHPLLHRKELSA